MGMTQHTDVERIPDDLDRFLGNFFRRGGWRSEIKYDPAEDRLYLDIRLAGPKLTSDDRFFSLVEYFGRAQDRELRQNNGLPLQCRVFAPDGSDLTTTSHARGSSYLDPDRRGAGMRRRLAWLSFRRRLVAAVLPGAFLWAAALVLVVVVLGVPLALAVIVAVVALAVQAAVLYAAVGRER
jgi:hypothetical protein